MISPLSGVISPQMSLRMVLFPEPENPTIARVSPLSTLKETSFITLFSPNVFIKFLTSMLR